mgnify:CR=1 FL=1
MTAMRLINIGFGNMVSANRLVAIVSPESAPIKRIIQDAKERGTLIDATYGRRTRAVLITDSDHVVLSAVQPETALTWVSNSFTLIPGIFMLLVVLMMTKYPINRDNFNRVLAALNRRKAGEEVDIKEFEDIFE